MNCPHCGALNNADAPWCGQCLKPIGGGTPSADVDGSAVAPAQYTPAQYTPAQVAPAQVAPQATQNQTGGSGRPVTLIIGIAVVALVVLGLGGYFVFLRSGTKTYTDGGLNFKVQSLKCGEGSRSVVEGEQGAVAKPRNLVAKGRFCIMQVDVTMALSGPGASTELQTLLPVNQKIVDSSGGDVKTTSVGIETITRPNSYYQPGPAPEIEPKKIVEARLIWDYPESESPAAAMLHAAADSPGVRVPVG